MKMTDKGVAALRKKEHRYERWEDGRTGLGVRVSSRGTKTWIYMYRFEGKPRRLTLGVYPLVGVADAKALYADAKKLIELGKDPGKEAVAKRQAERMAETTADLVEEYMAKWARPNKRSAGADERILRQDVLPALGKLKAREVTRRDVIKVLDLIMDRGSPVAANRTLSLVKRVFNFGIQRDIVDRNPAAGILPPAKETPRDRVLSPREIVTLWHSLDKANMSEEVRSALKLLMVTGQRPGEVVAAEWDEFDLDGKVWTIPALKAKNGIIHRVPLSDFALRVLSVIEIKSKSGEDDAGGDERWLFPSPRKNLDKPIGATAMDHAVRRNRKILGDFTPHDIRRTIASHLTGMGISRLVVAKILNHVDRSVTAIYDRYEYDSEKRHALDVWGQRLEEIISGTDTDNVVKLAAQEKRRG